MFGPGWTELEDVETESKIPQKSYDNCINDASPIHFQRLLTLKESQIHEASYIHLQRLFVRAFYLYL